MTKRGFKRIASVIITAALLLGMLCVGASAADPSGYTAEVTWVDPVVGEVTGTLILDPATETWEVSYDTDYGRKTLGGWYLADGTMGLTNDGGLGDYLDFSPLEAAAGPIIADLMRGEAPVYSAEITWVDPVVGQVTGTLILDSATGTWELGYDTDYGRKTLGGWYMADGTMGLTNDGGLGDYLDFNPVEAAASPVIIELVGKSTYFSDTVTWVDVVVGEVSGELIIYPALQEWEISYDTDYGRKTLGGWYVADGTMGLTNDGGLGDYLDIRPFEAAATPVIKELIKQSGQTGGSDPDNCSHRWKNGKCAACGTPCPHEEWEIGVCTACEYACEHIGTHDPDTLLCSVCGSFGYHVFEDYACDCGVTTIFEMDGIPEEYLIDCDQKGTVETITYTTEVYTTGEIKEVKAQVYLPYGYDAEKAYDILYLVHGMGADHEYWFGGGEMANLTTTILDNAIKSGMCDPVIVVTPTFNTNWVNNFGKELIDALIPAVESKYATYAEGDVSVENIKATRAHRAYAGLSMGSMVSWSSILDYCTDYVGYVGSYSCAPADDINKALGMVEDIAANMKEDLTAADNEIYFWFNGSGVKDKSHEIPQLYSYQKMLELCPDVFSDGVNSCWVDYPDGMHSAPWWQLDLFNSLKVFFKLDEVGEAPELEALSAEGKIHATGNSVSGTQADDVPFVDEVATKYVDAVSYMYQTGLMIGTSVEKEVFSGDVTMTRAQIAMILYRLAGKPETAYAGTFTDVAEGAWYAEAVEWAASQGIINGVGNGAFAHGHEINVEELAALVYQYAQYQLTGECKAVDGTTAVAWCVENGVLAEDVVSTDIANRYLTADMFYNVYNLLNK